MDLEITIVYFKLNPYNLQLIKNTRLHFRRAYELYCIRQGNPYFPSLVGVG